MKVPKEIAEARKYLEDAEREPDPERKMANLKEGLDLLDFYQEDNPELSEEIMTFIRNIRRAHTRRLLVQLLSMKRIDIEIWLDYIVLLIVRLKDEVSYATDEDPSLKANYDEFWELWSGVLKEAFEQRGEL